MWSQSIVLLFPASIYFMSSEKQQGRETNYCILPHININFFAFFGFFVLIARSRPCSAALVPETRLILSDYLWFIQALYCESHFHLGLWHEVTSNAAHTHHPPKRHTTPPNSDCVNSDHTQRNQPIATTMRIPTCKSSMIEDLLLLSIDSRLAWSLS